MSRAVRDALTKRTIEISSGRRRLPGLLVVPRQAVGVVAFAHGSGSSRHSPRNQYVASVLQEAGLATLLLDLLEESETDAREKVFDIELLAGRLSNAGSWLDQDAETRDLPRGYFGASTGAAAALVAAAREPTMVRAVVSRGGRPDLAGEYLPHVQAPTLLIVGSLDDVVVELNEEAFAALCCEKELAIVPGASHLFPEPGTLEKAAVLAQLWFRRHLATTPLQSTEGSAHRRAPR